MSNNPRWGSAQSLWSDADGLSPFAPQKPAGSRRHMEMEGPTPWVGSVPSPAGSSENDRTADETSSDGDFEVSAGPGGSDEEYEVVDFEDEEFDEDEFGEEAIPQNAFEESGQDSTTPEYFEDDYRKALEEDEQMDRSTDEDEDAAQFADEEFDQSEWEDNFEFDAPRERCPNSPATAKDKVSCSHEPQADARLCAPGANIRCPQIPELWVSSTIDEVPFYYGAVVTTVEGTNGKRKALVRVRNKAYEVRLTPHAWTAAQRWITSMRVFGMPIAAVITAGAGPYCRCKKKPQGVCRHDNPGACTGRSRSNHGAGDAIDITGVVWKDRQSVGSSLKATLMHSWSDTANQAPLLVRINAALRLSFATVIDYSNADHRDHFHVDTNQGRSRDVFTMPAEQWFLAGRLKALGYITSYGNPPTWADVQPGLTAFARQANIAIPTANDRSAWRPVVTRLYGCIAIGSPLHCRRR